jgi:hypothetical protein
MSNSSCPSTSSSMCNSSQTSCKTI